MADPTADLSHRRILVTGASSGIGRAVASAAARAGAAVGLLARRGDELAHLVDELEGADARGRAVTVPADVTDTEAVRDAVARAAEELGGLDAVVNSAGVARPSPISDAAPDDWQLMFDVNVVGLLAVTQAAIPHLRAADGPADVVNMSSMSGRRRASIALTVYSGTKYAVHIISDGLREELQPDGIRVSVIAPGFVRTPIFDPVEDDAMRERYQTAMEAEGLSPDEVAAQVVHLLAQPAHVVLHEIAMLHTNQV